MKTAIILGATGFTGGILLHKLLQDDRYSKIKLFSRTSIGCQKCKIEEHISRSVRTGETFRRFSMQMRSSAVSGPPRQKRQMRRRIKNGLWNPC